MRQEESDLNVAKGPNGERGRSVVNRGETGLRAGNPGENLVATIRADHAMSQEATPEIRLLARNYPEDNPGQNRGHNPGVDNPEEVSHVVAVRIREKAINNVINSAIREGTTRVTKAAILTLKKETQRAETRKVEILREEVPIVEIPNVETADEGIMIGATVAETLIRTAQTMVTAIQTPETNNENFYCVVPLGLCIMGVR